MRRALLAIGLVVIAGCDGAVGDGPDAATAPGDDGAMPIDDDASIAPDAGPVCEEATTIVSPTETGGTFRDRRPHYGARAEGHATCSTYWSNSLPDFAYASSWGSGCHTTRRYFLASSITSRAGWAEAVEAAFANWDIPTACTPHWTRTTDASTAHVTIRAQSTSDCAGAGTTWFACAWSGWSITLNTGVSWGVGVADRLDVESVVTVELAHVIHFAHSPDPADSVSLANVGRWGSRTMRVPSADSCDFSAYTACVPGEGCGYEACHPASAGGCGRYRELRAGDFALAEHLAGTNPSPPHAYDDGSVPADATFHDLAMISGTDATGTTRIDSFLGEAGALVARPEASRWSALGFPIDRVGDRLVAADLDGDGRDDLATVMPRCDGGARVHVWRSIDGGFEYGGDEGAIDLDGIDLERVGARVVAGDVDDDGDDDIALLEQLEGTAAAIRVVLGGATLTDGGVMWTVDRGYDLANVGDLFVAGDFTGDGRADVAAAYQYPDRTFRFHVWRSTGTALSYDGADGWYTSGTFTLAAVGGRIAAGDFDRDGRDDVAMLYGSAGRAILYAWIARDGAFALQPERWMVDTGYTLASVGARMVAADLDRDGRDDVATAYQYGDGTFRVHVLTATGSGFAYGGPAGHYQSGPFDLSTVGGRLVAGRFD